MTSPKVEGWPLVATAIKVQIPELKQLVDSFCKGAQGQCSLIGKLWEDTQGWGQPEGGDLRMEGRMGSRGMLVFHLVDRGNPDNTW